MGLPKGFLFKAFLLVFSVLFATLFHTKVEQTVVDVEKNHLAFNTFTKAEFDQTMQSFYQSLNAKNYDLSFQPFHYAMMGYYAMLDSDKLSNERYVSIIDFTKPSTDKRFYTIDLQQKKIVYHTYVAHGSNTGMNYAEKFSDTHQSHQSSLGFYVTGKTYIGSKGFSLKLHGDEKGYNRNMYDRAIVIHTANYVSEAVAQSQGRLGRSWGCPVLPETEYKPIINTIKNGSLIFAYYNDQTYLNTSKYLNVTKAVQAFAATQNHKYFSV